MEVSRGDLIDRYTIERRKDIYGAGDSELVLRLLGEIAKLHWDVTDIPQIIEIATANDSIAVLEWQIRADHKLSDEEIGKRAREIRKINERRVAAKARLDGVENKFAPAFNLDLKDLNLGIPDAAKQK